MQLKHVKGSVPFFFIVAASSLALIFLLRVAITHCFLTHSSFIVGDERSFVISGQRRGYHQGVSLRKFMFNRE